MLRALHRCEEENQNLIWIGNLWPGVVDEGWIPECAGLYGKMELQALWHQGTDIGCGIWWRAKLIIFCMSQTCIFSVAPWVRAPCSLFGLWTFTPQHGGRGVMRYTVAQLTLPNFLSPFTLYSFLGWAHTLLPPLCSHLPSPSVPKTLLNSRSPSIIAHYLEVFIHLTRISEEANQKLNLFFCVWQISFLKNIYLGKQKISGILVAKVIQLRVIPHLSSSLHLSLSFGYIEVLHLSFPPFITQLLSSFAVLFQQSCPRALHSCHRKSCSPWVCHALAHSVPLQMLFPWLWCPVPPCWPDSLHLLYPIRTSCASLYFFSNMFSSVRLRVLTWIYEWMLHFKSF